MFIIIGSIFLGLVYVSVAIITDLQYEKFLDSIGLDPGYYVFLREYGYMVFLFIGLALIIFPLGRVKQLFVCRIAGLNWDINNFCRGWLIIGETGSGKTAAGIMQILHQLFRNVNPAKGLKHWGGVAVDEKGNFFKIIQGIAKHYKQEDRLVVLQVRPEDAEDDWTPAFTYNLLSYPGIPESTFAKMIVDTASSLGQETSGSGNFFKTQAQLHIEWGIKFLKEFDREFGHSVHQSLPASAEGTDLSPLDIYKSIPTYVSISNVYDLLTNVVLFKKQISGLKLINNKLSNKMLMECIMHFEEKYIKQPDEQRGAVTSTIQNFLGFFNAPELKEVFCTEENSFDFRSIDEGIIFSISMPQKFQSERRYINTFFKLLYYTHALKRFDRPDDLRENNMLLFIADEAQGIVSSAKDGMSDYQVVDKIREAQATVLFATQSIVSFRGAGLSKEQVDTLILNLANRIIFKVPDSESADIVAEMIGQREVEERSRSTGKQGYTFSYSKKEKFIIPPRILRAFRKFECVLMHSDGKHRRLRLAPLLSDGSKAKYK